MQAIRKQFAAGDFLSRYPADHEYALRIDSPFEKPGWKSRSFSPTGHVLFPGSTIEFENTFYEIVFQDYEVGPPLMICYYLKLWDDRFPIRLQFHYNEEECRHQAHAFKERIQSNRENLALAILAPLAGMLPEEDQITLSNRYGIPATRMTFLSALVLLIPGGFGIIFTLARLFGEVEFPGPPWTHWLYPSGFYLFCESLLRMFSAARMEEPVGSLYVSFPILLWRAIRKSIDPGYRRRHPDQFHNKPDAVLSSARDELLEIQGKNHDLEVISILPKPHWNSKIAIVLNGVWYGLMETQTLKQGKDVRYRFLLKKALEETWFRSACEYDPEEVRRIYRDKRIIDLKTWVDTFATLWGFLSTRDQLRLEELYEFDALKFSRISAILVAVPAGVNLGVSGLNILYGISQPFDIVIALPAGLLLIESVSRFGDLRKGQPSGSILGMLFRPFAGRILRGP